MCHFATTTFDPDSEVVGAARRWVAGHVHDWGLDDLVHAATLLTSELVSNAVVHASSGGTLEVSFSERMVEVGVSDSEARMPRPPALQKDDLLAVAEGGRGLLLVEALADEWGVMALAGGKLVWFRLQTTERPGRPPCRCTDPSVPRHTLISGRFLHDQRGAGAAPH